MIDNRTYDRIKFIALLVAPVITCLSALCNIWHIPYTAEITATFAALDALVGAVVTILKKMHDDAMKEISDC